MAAAARRRKVCLIVGCDPKPRMNKMVEDLYVFDLDGSPELVDADNLTPVAPVLRFFIGSPVARFVTRFVINSRLYLFDGNEKSVHVHDLPSEPSSSTHVVTRDEMTLCSPMCGRKYFPHNIPTWDCQKVVVFSTVIVHPLQEGFVDVEVYDPVNETSSVLPPLPCPPHLEDSKYELMAYYFVNETTLVFHTDLANHVVITFDFNEARWEMTKGGGVVPRPVSYDGFVIGDALLVSHRGLYHMSRGWLSNDFPNQPNVKEELSHMSWLPVVIDNRPGREPEICILYVDDRLEDREYPRVYIELHQINPTTIFRHGGYSIITRGRGLNTIFHPLGRSIISGGRGSGRGGRGGGGVEIDGTMELRPTRSKTYGFELRMPYTFYSPHFAYADRAAAR